MIRIHVGFTPKLRGFLRLNGLAGRINDAGRQCRPKTYRKRRVIDMKHRTTRGAETCGDADSRRVAGSVTLVNYARECVAGHCASTPLSPARSRNAQSFDAADVATVNAQV